MNPERVIADRFAVEDEVHSGQMATIYRARDLTSGESVAVKVPQGDHDGIYRRFVIEAAILAELRHPAVVRYVAHGGERRDLHLALEWLEGENLLVRLERGRLEVRETLALGIRAAQALGAAHRSGIVHRDVKPSNIVLREGLPANAVLIDFGISRREQAGQGMSSHASFAGGTWAYMSPEQTMGAAELGGRADVFGLGCVLFECLCGKSAYPQDRSGAMVAKIWHDPPRVRAERADVPGALEELLLRMMSRDPALRPPHGDAVAAELASVAI